MSQRDAELYLVRMLEACREAKAVLGATAKPAYLADRTLRLALERLIEIIGEAARRVPPDTRAAYPAIPWADIVGMRNKLVHDYLEVDPEQVWQVVTGDLPGLIAELERTAPWDGAGNTQGPAGPVRESVAHPYQAAFEDASLERLRADLALSPEQRVRAVEDMVRMAQRLRQQPRVHQVLAFESWEDYFGWKRTDILR